MDMQQQKENDALVHCSTHDHEAGHAMHIVDNHNTNTDTEMGIEMEPYVTLGAVGEDALVPNVKRKRRHSIDLVRGGAIVVMLQANLSPYVQQADPSIYLRMLYSLAAPTFIFLAGYSAVTYSSAKSSQKDFLVPFSVRRILFAAAYVDMVGSTLYPFQTFDVLYPIGCTVWLSHHLQQQKLVWQHIVAAIVLIVWIVTFATVAYRFSFTELYIGESMRTDQYLSSIMRRFLIDGWFPLLPWMFVGLLGSYLSRCELLEASNPQAVYLKISAVVCCITCTIIYSIRSVSPVNSDREGYLEIFYPITPLFLCWSMSIVPLLVWGAASDPTGTDVIEAFLQKYKHNPICLLGRNSLMVYILHIFLISLFASYLEWPFIAIRHNIIGFLLIISVLIAICYVKEYTIPSHRIKTLPSLVRLLTGI